MRTAYRYPMSDRERRQHAQVAKLTQFLLMGDSWREVRRTMNLSHPEFTMLLNLAVDKAHGEALLDPHIGQLGPSPLSACRVPECTRCATLI